MKSQSPPRSDDRPDHESRTRSTDPGGHENEDEAPEDRPGEPGAEGGSRRPTRDKLPGVPDRSDPSPLGDTDQHSTG
jgi:hypothetical protein